MYKKSCGKKVIYFQRWKRHESFKGRKVTEGRGEGRAMVRIEEEKGVRNIWEIGWNDIEIIGWVTDCK